MATQEGYLGNTNLKVTNQNQSYTQEQIQEYLKCMEDPIYFIKNYIKIVHVDYGVVPFELYDFQEEMVEIIHENRFCIFKLPRQVGKTTTTVAYLLYSILFNKNHSVVILANKAEMAQEMLGRVQLAYENLPSWLQQGIVTWNKRNIELENGSKIKAAATSSSSVRGGSYNVIFLDEFAHIDNKLALEFFNSVYPTISSGKKTKVVVVSTPLGMNHFFQMWENATKAKELRKKKQFTEADRLSRFVPFECHWSQVPGRDEEWKEQEIANLGSVDAFEQEYGGEFIGSSNTLISKRKLRHLSGKYNKPLYTETFLDVYEEPKIDVTEDDDGNKIKQPHKYVIAADTAQGKQLDYSAFVVVDVTDYPYKIVAKYRSNEISPLMYPQVIYEVAKRYNHAHVLLEINDVGIQVAQILHHELEYENILTVQNKGRSGQILSAGFSKNTSFGVKMTTPVKQTGCANLKTLIEGEKLLTSDFDIIAELTTFVSKGKSFEAEEGAHDDLVMSLVVFSWAVSQKYFRELMDSDIRKSMEKELIDQMEYIMLPDPIVNSRFTDFKEREVSRGDVWEIVNDPWGKNWFF
jgi:hypothetical protein